MQQVQMELEAKMAMIAAQGTQQSNLQAQKSQGELLNTLANNATGDI